MPATIVLYDACVLYPAPLRDLLMHVALTDLYHAKWTHDIHEEWIRNVLKNRPDLKRAQLDRIRNLMDSHVRDCLVQRYEHLIPSLELPDPNDRHVLAAAIQASASIIITYNLKDFPKKTLDPYKIRAQHPDDFLTQLVNLDPATVCEAIRRLRLSLKNPPINSTHYLEILSRHSLLKTVKKLKLLEHLI